MAHDDDDGLDGTFDDLDAPDLGDADAPPIDDELEVGEAGPVDLAAFREQLEAKRAAKRKAEGPFELAPTDWAKLLTDGVPPLEYLRRPYLPKGARVWAWGPAEAGKSIWALATAAALSHDHVVAYVSGENPLVEDLRRLELLAPDPERLRFYSQPGLDLVRPDHARAFLEAMADVAFVVLDTLAAVWGGDENANDEVRALDRDVLVPLVGRGATVLVLDHTGHPSLGFKRKGSQAGRGASSKGQTADVTLQFEPVGRHGFTIEHGKNRLGGGMKEPPRTIEVRDTDDGLGLELVQVETDTDAELRELADRAVEVIREAGVIATGRLRQALGGSKDLAAEALRLLEREQPPRVRSGLEVIDTPGGKQRAKAWRLAGTLDL